MDCLKGQRRILRNKWCTGSRTQKGWTKDGLMDLYVIHIYIFVVERKQGEEARPAVRPRPRCYKQVALESACPHPDTLLTFALNDFDKPLQPPPTIPKTSAKPNMAPDDISTSCCPILSAPFYFVLLNDVSILSPFLNAISFSLFLCTAFTSHRK